PPGVDRIEILARGEGAEDPGPRPAPVERCRTAHVSRPPLVSWKRAHAGGAARTRSIVPLVRPDPRADSLYTLVGHRRRGRLKGARFRPLFVRFSERPAEMLRGHADFGGPCRPVPPEGSYLAT